MPAASVALCVDPAQDLTAAALARLCMCRDGQCKAGAQRATQLPPAQPYLFIAVLFQHNEIDTWWHAWMAAGLIASLSDGRKVS